MKKIITRLVVLFAIVALVFGSLPTDSAQAAKKKSKTSITVSTQEELVKALKSGKYKKITIKTDAKVSFTLAAKYSNSDLKIVVDAKNATFNSKGTVGSIVVNEAKTVKEYASGNNITVNDEKLTFKAMEGASVEKLKIASETGEVKVVNNGEIGRVDVTGESKVDVEQNGSVGRLYVAAAAEIGVTGTSEEKLAVTVKPEAAGAAVKSELPVKVNAYADVDLQLEKGAENSAVTLKNEDAGVKLENNTDKKVTVTDSDGEKQTVKKGEDLTSDNYVGKPEETDDGTEGETSGTPSDGTEVDKKEDENKEEEKKEDKEEEKKDDTTSTGNTDGGSSGESGYVAPPTAEETLISNLAAAESNFVPDTEPQLVYLTSNVTLTDDLTVPANTILFVGHNGSNSVLNADSYKIKLQETATILVTPGSKLIVPNNSVELAPTDRVKFPYDEADAGIDIQPGGEVKYGAYTFTADNGIGVSEDYAPIGRLHWLRKFDWKEVENEPGFHFELDFVEIQNLGGTVQITGDSEYGYDKLPEAFGLGNMILPTNLSEFEQAWGQSGKGDVLSTLSFVYVPDVRANTFVTKFNNDVVFTANNTAQDWLNAYLDPELEGQVEEAVNELQRTPLVRAEVVPGTESNTRIVKLNSAVDITEEIRVPVGTTLELNAPLNISEYSGFVKVFGTLKSNVDDNDGLGVYSTVMGTDKENVDRLIPHLIVELCGPAARLVLKNGDEYFIWYEYSDGREIDYGKLWEKFWDRQELPIEVWRDPVTNTTNTVWEYIYIPEISEGSDTQPHMIVRRKSQGQEDSAAVEVVNHPFKDTFIALDTLKEKNTGKVENLHQFVNLLDWSSSVAWLYAEEKLPIIRYDDERFDLKYEDLTAQAFDGIDTYENIPCHEYTTDSTKSISLVKKGVGDNGFPIGWDLSGVKLTIPHSDGKESLRLKQETNLGVNMGATLVVDSVAAVAKDSSAADVALALEYDDAANENQNKSARIEVKLGGSLQIGGIKVSVPDNCTGDWDKDPSITLSAEFDSKRTSSNKAYLRLQVPKSVTFTKVDTGTAPSVMELNAWLTSNNISIDYSNADKVNNDEHGNEYLTIMDGEYWILERAPGDAPANNTIAEAKVPDKDNEEYYNVSTRNQLLAIYLKEGGDAEGIKVRISSTPDGGLPIDTNLYTMWSIEVATGAHVNVTPGCILEAGIKIASGGAIEVQVDRGDKGDANGQLWTTQGGDIVVEGTLIVHNSNPQDESSVDCAKAVIKSGKGRKVVVKEGASFMLYGNFECACINNAPLFVVENRNNVTGNASGFIALVDDPNAASAGTPNNYATEDLRNSVKAMILEGSEIVVSYGWGE